MAKVCTKIPVIEQELRKAWLEKQNNMIKTKDETPEPSVVGSSLFSNNKSLSDVHGDFSSRNQRGRLTPSRIACLDIMPELSEEDKKILRLMAHRREAAIKDEEMAHSVRNMWAEEQKMRAKNFEEKTKSWSEYIARKRRTENLAHCWRKKNQIDAMEEEKILLESRINEKHEKTERRKMEISSEKKKLESNTWLMEVMHRQLRRQQEWDEEYQCSMKQKYYQEKARRAEEKMKLVWSERMRKIKDSSLRRDIKWQAAKEMRDEIRRKEEEMQNENVKREETSQVLRQHRVMDAIEWKRKMALEKNEMKKQYHTFLYNKIKEEEREKEKQARMHLHAKDERIKAIRERKQKAISRSRSNSRAAANLREKIKSSYEF